LRRTAHPARRVLMLTASGQVEDRVEGLNLGPTTTWPSLVRIVVR
jgi:DNA-binding response OmpR family regulator